MKIFNNQNIPFNMGRGTIEDLPKLINSFYQLWTKVLNLEAKLDKFIKYVLDKLKELAVRVVNVNQTIINTNETLEKIEKEVLLDCITPLIIDSSEGSVFHIILSGDIEISNPINSIAAKKMIIRLEQDGTGSREISAWGSDFRFSTDLPEPTLTTTAEVSDYYGFIYNGIDEKWDLVGQVQGF